MSINSYNFNAVHNPYFISNSSNETQENQKKRRETDSPEGEPDCKRLKTINSETQASIDKTFALAISYDVFDVEQLQYYKELISQIIDDEASDEQIIELIRSYPEILGHSSDSKRKISPFIIALSLPYRKILAAKMLQFVFENNKLFVFINFRELTAYAFLTEEWDFLDVIYNCQEAYPSIYDIHTCVKKHIEEVGKALNFPKETVQNAFRQLDYFNSTVITKNINSSALTSLLKSSINFARSHEVTNLNCIDFNNLKKHINFNIEKYWDNAANGLREVIARQLHALNWNVENKELKECIKMLFSNEEELEHIKGFYVVTSPNFNAVDIPPKIYYKFAIKILNNEIKSIPKKLRNQFVENAKNSHKCLGLGPYTKDLEFIKSQHEFIYTYLKNFKVDFKNVPLSVLIEIDTVYQNEFTKQALVLSLLLPKNDYSLISDFEEDSSVEEDLDRESILWNHFRNFTDELINNASSDDPKKSLEKAYGPIFENYDIEQGFSNLLLVLIANNNSSSPIDISSLIAKIFKLFPNLDLFCLKPNQQIKTVPLANLCNAAYEHKNKFTVQSFILALLLPQKEGISTKEVSPKALSYACKLINNLIQIASSKKYIMIEQCLEAHYGLIFKDDIKEGLSNLARVVALDGKWHLFERMYELFPSLDFIHKDANPPIYILAVADLNFELFFKLLHELAKHKIKIPNNHVSQILEYLINRGSLEELEKFLIFDPYIDLNNCWIEFNKSNHPLNDVFERSLNKFGQYRNRKAEEVSFLFCFLGAKYNLKITNKCNPLNKNIIIDNVWDISEQLKSQNRESGKNKASLEIISIAKYTKHLNEYEKIIQSIEEAYSKTIQAVFYPSPTNVFSSININDIKLNLVIESMKVYFPILASLPEDYLQAKCLAKINAYLKTEEANRWKIRNKKLAKRIYKKIVGDCFPLYQTYSKKKLSIFKSQIYHYIKKYSLEAFPEDKINMFINIFCNKMRQVGNSIINGNNEVKIKNALKVFFKINLLEITKK